MQRDVGLLQKLGVEMEVSRQVSAYYNKYYTSNSIPTSFFVHSQ